MGKDNVAEKEDTEHKYISIDDFKKIDLKIAEILEAEKIPKTDKLVKLHVQLENEERQIVAGIAQSYELEDLIGRQVVIVTNLEPVSIRGEISNGMLLAANDGNKLSLISPFEKIKNGAKIS
jgi:methionyl-tRNA synthetase